MTYYAKIVTETVAAFALFGLIANAAPARVTSSDPQSNATGHLAWDYVAKAGTECVPQRLQRLIKDGGNPNYERQPASLLNEAIAVGANSCAIELLKLGATDGITKPDSLGAYAINAASRSPTCNAALVGELLEHGADLESKGLGGPPLVEAAFAKNVGCAQFLIHRGARLNEHAGDRAMTPLMAAQLPSVDSKLQDVRLRVEMTRTLIKAGAQVDAKQRMGRTALFWAVGLRRPISPCPRCAKLLLEAGANPNIMDKAGKSPLLWALESKHQTTLVVVKVLVKGGANVNLANPNTGETPLMAAAARGNGMIVHYLLKAGAKRCARDKKARTAGDYARVHRHLKIASLVACPAS